MASQTASSRPQAPEQSVRRLQQTPSQSKHATPERSSALNADHQRFVLTDPVAFQYLEADKSTQVLARHQELQGYECYLVEQWITSRIHPTFIISTYTGDASHSVFVDVLSVPSDEQTWSPRLRVYFKAINQYHARRETTPLGTLMVTNLASFPSTLTVIPIPGGDIRQHRSEFLVNENLKRMGCSGRLGLTLSAPPANATAKFLQLYHVSDKNPVQESVVELVKMCQLALILFDKLDPDFADGLLCDVTEHAISKWWNDIGAEQYGIEPHDGVLGPTTVAALLGTLMGARNRLHATGVSVTKDPFDMNSMKRGISSFQKQQRLERTRRLDRQTMKRLIQVTAKAAAHEGWNVPRAVKSTVAELSGRGGEMLSDVVGRRERAGIAEVETIDYERFVQLSFGPKARWLWQGKPLKKLRSPDDVRHMLPFTSDNTTFTKLGRKQDTPSKESAENRQADEARTPDSNTDNSDADENKMGLRKRAVDLKNEAMSGFGKIKGAVNFKNQQRLLTKDRESSSASPNDPPAAVSDDSSPASPFSGPASPMSPTIERMADLRLPDHPASPGWSPDHRSQPEDSPSVPHLPELRIQGTVYEGVDLKESLPEAAETQHDVSRLLRRTISDSLRTSAKDDRYETDYYPKHLSFSLAEDSVLPWSALSEDGSNDEDTAIKADYADQALQAEEKKSLRFEINKTQLEAVEWTQQQLYTLRELATQYQADAEELDGASHAQRNHLQEISAKTDLLLRSEKERLDEGNKELDTLSARLTYEIDGLRGRIEDVEHIVDDFEKGVARVEERVADLEHDGDGSHQWHCLMS